MSRMASLRRVDLLLLALTTGVLLSIVRCFPSLSIISWLALSPLFLALMFTRSYLLGTACVLISLFPYFLAECAVMWSVDGVYFASRWLSISALATLP